MSAQIQVARLVATDKPLEVGTADKPKPGPKDVLVRVAACSFVRRPSRSPTLVRMLHYADEPCIAAAPGSQHQKCLH